MRVNGRVYRLWSLLSTSVAVMLLLASCSTPSGSTANPTTAPTQTSSTPTQTPDTEKTLTIGLNTGMLSFDIHNHGSTETEAVHVNLFNYLLSRDNDGNIHPDLAESFEKIDDRTWHFVLKKGVKFHNGDPFTAQDVKYSLERVAKDPKLLENSRYNTIKEVRIADDYSFDIITNGPDPVLPNRLSRIGSGMLPKSYIEKEGFDAFLAKPVGTGPYQFVEWKKGDRVVLKKFADYFEGNITEWDKVIFREIPETSTRVSELLTGGVDLAAKIPPADWDRIQNNKGTELLPSNSSGMMMLIVRHTEGSPTANPKVREAIDYAINNKLLIDNILKGAATPTRTYIDPSVKGYLPSLYNTYRYDPAKAKQLLKEAGYPDGVDITLQSPQGRLVLDTDVSQAVASMLTEAGIRTKVEILENSKYVEIRGANKNTELMLTNYGNSMFDPALPLGMYHSQSGLIGQMGYHNPKIDELLDKAAVNMNPEERQKQYQQIQEIAAEDLPYIMLYHDQYFTGVRDKIEFKPRPDGMYYARDIKTKQ